MTAEQAWQYMQSDSGGVRLRSITFYRASNTHVEMSRRGSTLIDLDHLEFMSQFEGSTFTIITEGDKAQ